MPCYTEPHSYCNHENDECIEMDSYIKEQFNKLTNILCKLMQLLEQCEKEGNTPWGYGYGKDLITWWQKHKDFDKSKKF